MYKVIVRSLIPNGERTKCIVAAREGSCVFVVADWWGGGGNQRE